MRQEGENNGTYFGIALFLPSPFSYKLRSLWALRQKVWHTYTQYRHRDSNNISYVLIVTITFFYWTDLAMQLSETGYHTWYSLIDQSISSPRKLEGFPDTMQEQSTLNYNNLGHQKSRCSNCNGNAPSISCFFSEETWVNSRHHIWAKQSWAQRPWSPKVQV